MERTTRRMFCGAAILAVPALPLLAGGKSIGENDFSDLSDPIFSALADEFVRVTADGAQFGFKAEHFRRYAGFVRILDAHMENKGLNREINKRLDVEDFHKLDPAHIAKSTVEYWRKHNVEMREDELAERLMTDWRSYVEIKKAIKNQGGIRALHAKIADLLERKAKEYEISSLRGGPVLQEGRILFPRQNDHPRFVEAQLDWIMSVFLGVNMDCLCKAMKTTAAICSVICIVGAPAFCIPAAFLVAIETLIEGLYLCDPGKC